MRSLEETNQRCAENTMEYLIGPCWQEETVISSLHRCLFFEQGPKSGLLHLHFTPLRKVADQSTTLSTPLCFCTFVLSKMRLGGYGCERKQVSFGGWMTIPKLFYFEGRYSPNYRALDPSDFHTLSRSACNQGTTSPLKGMQVVCA